MSRVRAARRLVWLGLLGAWGPVWVLFLALILSAHQNARFLDSALVALRLMVTAAVLGTLVQRLAGRLPWPHRFRLRFAALHLGAAILYAAAWILLNSLVESLLRRQLVLIVGPGGIGGFLVLGVWLYLIVAGVAYAAQATERAARAEAIAAESQLAALRAQLNPHFLFNALHTVVQLIPREPGRAAAAAERLAALLRTTTEEDRDLVSLAEEWAFVEQYLEIERLRFGDRLRVHLDLSAEALRALVPSFALQSLVENAIRHGAAPAVDPTDVTVSGSVVGGALRLRVTDSGAGATAAAIAASSGTGLRRLRDRLEALHGSQGQLELTSTPGAGLTATLVIPQADAE